MLLLKLEDSLGASSNFSTLNVASLSTLFVLLSLWKHVDEGSLQGGSMYPYKFATQHPERAAFVMADSGQSVSYAEFEMRANRLAHFLRSEGLGRQDHYSIMMENNDRYLEACAAGERTGLYYMH